MSTNPKKELTVPDFQPTLPIRDLTNIRHTRSLTRSVDALIDIDLPRFYSLSDPPSNPSEVSSEVFNVNMDFAKASRDIRSMVRPFSGKDKSIDVFGFIAKFNLAIKAYPDLEKHHKTFILQTLLEGSAEVHVSNLLLTNPHMVEEVDKILDSLVAVFVAQKTPIARQNYINSLKQADGEDVNLFASLVGISVYNINHLEYKALATATGASEEIRQAIDPVAYPDEVATTDSEADKIRKVKLMIIRAERKREQSSTLLGVFLRGIKPNIGAELVKSGVEKMNYEQALAKAIDIENSHKGKQQVNIITEVGPATDQDTKEDSPTHLQEANVKGATFEDNIEAIAQRVAQINLDRNKASERGSGSSANRRGRGRGRGRYNSTRGRTGFRGRRGNYSNGFGNQGRRQFNGICLLCKEPNHMVDQCVHNPFNKQQQPRYGPPAPYGPQYPSAAGGGPSSSQHGRVSAINAAEHLNIYELPNF